MQVYGTRKRLSVGRLSGCLLGGGVGEGHLRQDVHVAGRPRQQDSRDQEQETVFHRRTGHRRLRDLRGNPAKPLLFVDFSIHRWKRVIKISQKKC